MPEKEKVFIRPPFVFHVFFFFCIGYDSQVYMFEVMLYKYSRVAMTNFMKFLRRHRPLRQKYIANVCGGVTSGIWFAQKT